MHPGWLHQAFPGPAPRAGRQDRREGESGADMQDHPAPTPCSLQFIELMPGSCLSKAKASPCRNDREVAQDEPKSPGRHWVLPRVLDTVEEHLAQEVHGLEDVLHGVDPARLCEEWERGTARRRGARVWPGVHTESRLSFSGLIQHQHSLAFGGALHPFSSSKHLWAMPLAPRPPMLPGGRTPYSSPQAPRQLPESSKAKPWLCDNQRFTSCSHRGCRRQTSCHPGQP